MKNEYFGDQRDFVKYDYLLDLLGACPGLGGLTLIPMLTPDEARGEGNRRGYGRGERRADLFDLFSSHREPGQRKLSHLRDFFSGAGIAYRPYLDDAFFEPEERSDYFAGVPGNWLRHALVFVDPDVGLETGGMDYVQRRGPEKYLLYSEVRELLDRMSPDSVLVVYQHLQNNKDRVRQDLGTRFLRLGSEADVDAAACISDSEIALLAMSRDPSRQAEVDEATRSHAGRHGLRFAAYRRGEQHDFSDWPRRANEGRILVPATSPADWKRGLADPDRQWKPGRSAQLLAHRWMDADGFPQEVGGLWGAESSVPRLELLFAIPEHRVAMPERGAPSQIDLWALAKSRSGLVSIAVEGKVGEPFGPVIGEWLAGGGENRRRRLAAICDLLGLPRAADPGLRYQLFHRTASAVLEAERWGARHAVMVVHSFSPELAGFEDYRRFLELFRLRAGVGRLVEARPAGTGCGLHFGWAVAPTP